MKDTIWILENIW